MKKVLLIWIVTLAYIIGIGSLLVFIPLPVTFRSYLADVILLLGFFLWNHFVFKQKILVNKYPFWKSFGLLGYSWYLLLSGFVVFAMRGLPASNILFALGAIIIGAAEEFVFRGLIFGHLMTIKKSFLFPLFFSSFLFACSHAINILHQPLLNTVIQVLYVFPMGVFLAVIYLKSNNLILPMIAHAIQDFTAIMISGGSASSGLTNPMVVIELYIIFGTISALFLVFGSKQIALFKERISEN